MTIENTPDDDSADEGFGDGSCGGDGAFGDAGSDDVGDDPTSEENALSSGWTEPTGFEDQLFDPGSFGADDFAAGDGTSDACDESLFSEGGPAFGAGPSAQSNGGEAGAVGSLRGRFLIAGSHLRDRNFFKTVVLVLEHTPAGAMGLVINRPSSLAVAHALAGHFELDESDETVFLGGPVEPADLFLLHHDDAWNDVSFEIAPGVFVTTDPQAFEAIVTDQRAQPRRVLSGYAGWGPGQLESELETGDWLSLEASLPDVFGTDPYELWDGLKERALAEHRLIPAHAPHPEWN